MLEVTECRDEADEQRSLDVYNEVWPHDRVSIDEVRSFKASVLAHVDLLARVDGELAGSAVGVVLPHRPDRVFTLVTVLEEQRRHGAGGALYAAVSAWAVKRDIAELETPVLDNDPASQAYAERRGFAEERRELGVVLHLAEIEPPTVALPDGIEIVTWAERPELARGMYDVMLESVPDIPGSEDEELEGFDDWLAHDMQGSGDRPEATFVAVAGDEVVGYAKF